MTGQDDPRSIRGRVPTSEPWIPVRDLNNEGAELVSRGQIDEGARMLREAIARTDGSDDIDARDLRSRALLNLSGAHDHRAELDEALQLVDESMRVGTALMEEVGDERGTRTVLVNAMISRTQILAQGDHLPEALSQVDEALATLDAYDVVQGELMRFQAHNIRSSLLMFVGRLEEAEGDARRALDLAARVDPSLATHAYLNLAAIAQQTGDLEAAKELIDLAHELQGEDSDVVTRQITLENRARSAMRQERFDEAGDLFRQSAEVASDAGLVTRATASRMGAAAAYLQTGNPVLAAKILRQLIAELGTEGAVHDRREAYSHLGDAESKRGKFVKADEAYRAARELSRSAYERCRVDLRRAEMQAEWASFTPMPGKRLARLRTGLDMAIPVLLATEALRSDFAPGPVRERWSLQVSAPARELSFRLATTLGDAEVLFALIENATASATLQSEAIEARMPTAEAAEITPFPLPSSSEDEPLQPDDAHDLPSAASGFVGEIASSMPLRFAPPPRVIAIPGTEPVLERWIGIAEAEYGVVVRSESVVASW